MKRRTFDAMLASTSLILAVVLLLAGALFAWGSSFANSNVRTQLAQQKITFPTVASIKAANDPEITKYVTPYAGQQVLTGKQAEVFADHYISVHLTKVANGQTYSQVSATYQTLSPTDPTYATIGAERQTLFMGETLRGLLLNAYAYGKMGALAGIAAIVAFILGGLMVLFAAFGFLHLSRVSAESETLPSLHLRKGRLTHAHAN